MKKHLLIGTLILVLTSANRVDAGWHHRGDHEGRNVSVSTDNHTDGPIDDCGQIRVRFGATAAARAQEDLTASLPHGTLTVHVPDASGVFVQGADRRDTTVRVCKAALRSEDLARIAVAAAADGPLSISGPENGDWLVYLLVQTPRGTAVDLAATNGPISIRGTSGGVTARTSNGPLSLSGLAGRVDARAQNGPISIHNCSGSVDAEAVNGPISLAGGGGTQKLSTQNGPISVDLAGDHWNGPSLVAHAANGPLSVHIPEGYRSGTRIESSGHSPFTCRAAACAQGRKSWDDESRAIEFGDRETVVRLSTINGPVSIRSRGNDDEEDDD